MPMTLLHGFPKDKKLQLEAPPRQKYTPRMKQLKIYFISNIFAMIFNMIHHITLSPFSTIIKHASSGRTRKQLKVYAIYKCRKMASEKMWKIIGLKSSIYEAILIQPTYSRKKIKIPLTFSKFVIFCLLTILIYIQNV